MDYVLCQCLSQKSGVLLLPHIPKFLRRAGGGILHSILISCHNNLSKLIKLWNIFFLLVADVLLHSLLYTNLWSFALDDGEWDAVNKQHNIRTNIVELVPAVHRKLLGDMEQVVFPMLPVNKFQVKTESFTFSHSLRVAFAQ